VGNGWKNEKVNRRGDFQTEKGVFKRGENAGNLGGGAEMTKSEVALHSTKLWESVL